MKLQINKKVKGLPVWAWILLLGGGLVAAIYIRRRNANGEEDVAPMEAATTDTQDGSLLPSYGTIPTDPVQFPSEADPGLEPPRVVPIVLDIAVQQSTPTQQSPASGKSPQPSFTWGGRVWHSGQRPAFERWLKAHGSTFAGWARNHPTAAKNIYGYTAPPAKPVAAKKPAPKPHVGGGAPKASVAHHAPPPAPKAMDTRTAVIRAIQSAAKPKPKPPPPKKKAVKHR